MSSFIVHTGLETPLILDEEREELLELVDEEDERAEVAFFGSSWDYCCLLLVMPALLVVQFHVAFQVESDLLISQNSVGFTIFLFVAASYMYKTCIQQDHNEWMQRRSASIQQLVLLTPEILMDLVLGVVLLSTVGFAFEVLLYTTMFLAVVVIASTGTALYHEFCLCSEDDDEDDIDSKC